MRVFDLQTYVISIRISTAVSRTVARRSNILSTKESNQLRQFNGAEIFASFQSVLHI